MERRDFIIATIGALNILVGAYTMMNPDTAMWWAGLFFAISGTVILFLLWVPIITRATVGSPYFLSRRLPQYLAEWRDWKAFKPHISCDDIIDSTRTNYQASGRAITTCNIFINFLVIGNHKIGNTHVDFNKTILTLSQKRGGILYNFTFHPLLNTPTEAVIDTSDVGIAYTQHLTYSSDKGIGTPKQEAPNLELESSYEIAGVVVTLSGPLTVTRALKPFKGRLLGKLE